MKPYMACAAALLSIYWIRLNMSVESFLQSRLAIHVRAKYAHNSSAKHATTPFARAVSREALRKSTEASLNTSQTQAMANPSDGINMKRSAIVSGAKNRKLE